MVEGEDELLSPSRANKELLTYTDCIAPLVGVKRFHISSPMYRDLFSTPCQYFGQFALNYKCVALVTFRYKTQRPPPSLAGDVIYAGGPVKSTWRHGEFKA